MIENVILGLDVLIYHPDLCNLYGCTVGAFSTVGPFVEIQRGAEVGQWTKVCSHTFICAGVKVGDRCFIGHGVMFTNDLYPVIGGPVFLRACTVGDDVSIGSGATILPVDIGAGAIVGAGAVVTRDVPALSVVVGNPAQVIREFRNLAERDDYLRTKAENERNHLYAVA